MLLGPVLLAVYELATEPSLRGRPAVRFGACALGLTLLLSLWWAIPAYVQSAYGNDFLRFTEQPGTVWGTTSATETLRLMGFWLSYVGIGFGGPPIPYFDDSHTLLFSPPVLVATLLLPAAAFGGFVWTRRWRHGPFFVLLTIVAALVVGAGYPDGTPLRHGLYFLYNHVAALQFLRTSYKAAPLLVVSFAMLIGAAAGYGWPALRGAGTRAAAVLAGLAVVALAGWPLVTGRAQDAQVSLHAVPAAWRAAAADLRTLPAGQRAVVLPGALFAFDTWGGTVDPILPALTARPVAERTEVPYADPHATDLLWELNDLVSQRRLLPGQLGPLLSLAGAGAVITATDSDRRRSDAPPPADIAAELAGQAGFAQPAHAFGPARPFLRHDVPASALALPEVRRYASAPARAGIRAEPRATPLIIDGSAADVGRPRGVRRAQRPLARGSLRRRPQRGRRARRARRRRRARDRRLQPSSSAGRRHARAERRPGALGAGLGERRRRHPRPVRAGSRRADGRERRWDRGHPRTRLPATPPVSRARRDGRARR